MKNSNAKSTTKEKTIKKVVVNKTNKILALNNAHQALFRADAKQTASLVKVGRLGALKAIKASKAMGLPITFMKKGIMYKEFPDGSVEVVRDAPSNKPVADKPKSILKKGMVLYAKK